MPPAATGSVLCGSTGAVVSPIYCGNPVFVGLRQIGYRRGEHGIHHRRRCIVMAETKRMPDFVQRNHVETQIQGADLHAALKMPSFIAVEANLYRLEPVARTKTILRLAGNVA